MTAVRGSLDYSSTLQTVVSVLGKAFSADLALLHPIGFLPSEAQPQALLVYRPAPPTATAKTFCPDLTALSDLPESLEIMSESVLIEGQSAIRIVVPFVDQGQSIATLCLYKKTRQQKWASSAIALLKNVSSQVALAISHANLYQQSHQQSVKMRAELEVARQIQSNLLHQSWPEIAGIKIQARCQPAREVGGDFFEVFMHPQGDIWLAVGDVSGKGVPAALFMASAISVLRRELAQEKSPDPDKVMHNLNHSLSNDLMGNNCFITMALIRYSPKTGELVYANAGHVYPIVWSHRDMVMNHRSVKPTYLDVRGVPLGILPTWTASAGTLQLSDGDILLLISDGITEATVPSCKGNSRSCMLNQEGLWDFLQQQPAELNLDHLLAYIRPVGK